MRFFRDGCVSAVLESSYTLCILRFSVRRFLALTQKTLFFEVPFSRSELPAGPGQIKSSLWLIVC